MKTFYIILRFIYEYKHICAENKRKTQRILSSLWIGIYIQCIILNALLWHFKWISIEAKWKFDENPIKLFSNFQLSGTFPNATTAAVCSSASTTHTHIHTCMYFCAFVCVSDYLWNCLPSNAVKTSDYILAKGNACCCGKNLTVLDVRNTHTDTLTWKIQKFAAYTGLFKISFRLRNKCAPLWKKHRLTYLLNVFELAQLIIRKIKNPSKNNIILNSLTTLGRSIWIFIRIKT